jgi:hypothetical protein
MWHDIWSPWLIMSIIVYGALLASATMSGLSTFRRAKSLQAVKGLAVSLLILIVPGGLFNGLTYMMSSGFSTVSPAPDLTESFGFKSGQAYDLIVGERFGGSVVDARGRRWSFTIKSIPASAISVSFAGANDKFYIFDIPLNKVTFTQREDVAPTMTLNLWSDEINRLFSESKLGDSTPCHKGFKALMLACHSNVSSIRTPNAGVIEDGLSPLVMNYLDNAQMTVTPKMYDKILGKTG